MISNPPSLLFLAYTYTKGMLNSQRPSKEKANSWNQNANISVHSFLTPKKFSYKRNKVMSKINYDIEVTGKV